jgi:hypothetical protein
MGSAVMPEPAKRILTMEDEFYLREDCAQEVVRHGMQVIGPVTNAERDTVIVEKPMSANHVVLKLMECLARQHDRQVPR